MEFRFFLANFIDIFAQLLIIAIFARVIISWFIPSGSSRGGISQFINDITEPILGPIRKIMPRTGMLDLSPIIAFLLIEFFRYLILSVI